ncbi:hypothetical protein [Streptomyces sp. NPDC013455]|uniref:hypothetical protein n=1 Tax=Streptomyces sp. NPDC013455 TaxID=3155605 RepID=UPI0033DA0C3D
MAGCGLRLGEAMAVSRDQVDFKAETLRVDHGVWGPERLLFPNVTRTGYLYASYFYPKIWMMALDKGGVTYCKPHSLRHYATMLTPGADDPDDPTDASEVA